MRAVLLVGGTGNLGGLIGRELLKRGARLRLLVRPGSRSKVCRGAGERPGVAPVDVLARHAERSGQLGPLMNDRYPDIRPTGVREYVTRLATERTSRTSGGAQG